MNLGDQSDEIFADLLKVASSGKSAGLIGPVYRGIPIGAKWDREIKNDQYTVGNFYSSSRDVAKAYGDQVFQAHLKIDRPYVVDAEENSYFSIPTPKEMQNWVVGEMVDSDLIAEFAHKNGYDGVILKNVVEPNHPVTADDYIVFNSSQVKQVKVLRPTHEPADCQREMRGSVGHAKVKNGAEWECSCGKRWLHECDATDCSWSLIKAN